MEEELNENELEEQFYSMLHYVNEKQDNVNSNEKDALVENAPRSTVRRYWRTSTSGNQNTAYQKVNQPKDTSTTNNDKTSKSNNAKPKEEKPTNSDSPTPIDISIFQSPVPQNVKKTIEILENDDNRIVELESSDEDDIMEVVLPPKPTITIESSDEDEVSIVTSLETPTKKDAISNNGKETGKNRERDVSASPVPSVVSSVSDEFIRGDCIALKISSRHSDNPSFDFSLHGSDLIDSNAPAKKRKKKKKENVTSTPIASNSVPPKSADISNDQLFLTPKSKANNKKQKSKSYAVTDVSLPSADVYDSDSNQSAIDTHTSRNDYSVTEKSLPSTDLYESDSSQSMDVNKSKQTSPNSNINISETLVETPRTSKRISTGQDFIVDLTDINESNVTIEENFIMANVTGFQQSEDYGETTCNRNLAPKLGSTKIPPILLEKLDFDSVKGNIRLSRHRRYSMSSLRTEMEKFYNDSWGGEEFDHREIQKHMSRDKSLWAIDPKDRMPTPSKRKITCNYCNRAGHRDDTCRQKPAVCHMCGLPGHFEPRCPSKMCVNCGSPNTMYSTMCRNCASWGRLNCAECGQRGHPSSHCPDVWRRYHNTIDENMPLEENRRVKKHNQLYCSGCARRGHLVHTCRLTDPFGLPIYSPYVAVYRPVYTGNAINQNQNNAGIQTQQRNRKDLNKSLPQDAIAMRNERHKRQSKSPAVHETHQNKRRCISESGEDRAKVSTPTNDGQNKDVEENKRISNDKSLPAQKPPEPSKASDFIPISSPNHDKQGQMIQDNEVSDTSDVITSSRIYVTNDIIDKLQTKDGADWLKSITDKHNISVESTENKSFLSIKGKVVDQEAFQCELRDWNRGKKDGGKSDNECDISQDSSEQHVACENIPRNRNNLIRRLSKALDSLKEDLGDPKELYKELSYLQNRHDNLLKQKVISPKTVSNNRDHINEMLKKLNMILLGQAGLAGGSNHLSELHALQEKLQKSRSRNIPFEIRNEIGQHYHSIFTATPRDDYAELLKMYGSINNSMRNKMFKKRNKQGPFYPRKKMNAMLVEKNDATDNVNVQMVNHWRPVPVTVQMSKPVDRDTINKLMYYHKQVMNSRPGDSVQKKTRMHLVRRLYSHISTMNKDNQITPKTNKKYNKTCRRAQGFLQSNV